MITVWVFVFATVWYSGAMHHVGPFANQRDCEEFRKNLTEGHPHKDTLLRMSRCVEMRTFR